jgi:hypothetical protein
MGVTGPSPRRSRAMRYGMPSIEAMLWGVVGFGELGSPVLEHIASTGEIVEAPQQR